MRMAGSDDDGDGGNALGMPRMMRMWMGMWVEIDVYDARDDDVMGPGCCI